MERGPRQAETNAARIVPIIKVYTVKGHRRQPYPTGAEMAAAGPAGGPAGGPAPKQPALPVLPALSNELVEGFKNFRVITGLNSKDVGQPLWTITNHVLVFKYGDYYHHPAQSPTPLGTATEGSNGSLYEITYLIPRPGNSPLNLTVVLKTQLKTATRGLNTATNLRDCGLVKFVYFDVPFKKAEIVDGRTFFYQHWTIMEKLTTDLSKYVKNAANDTERLRRETQDKFATFMAEALKCIVPRNSSYTDMKLPNVGAKITEEGKIQKFSLIDIDSLDGRTATYPIGPEDRWIYFNPTYEDQKKTTEYAFGVTTALFANRGLVERDGYRFWYDSIQKNDPGTSPNDRRCALIRVRDQVPGENTKRLIQGAINILTDTFKLSAETCSVPVPLPVLLDYRNMYVRERQKAVTLTEKAKFFDHTVQKLEQEIAGLRSQNDRIVEDLRTTQRELKKRAANLQERSESSQPSKPEAPRKKQKAGDEPGDEPGDSANMPIVLNTP